jgi:hypothetical protein
MPDTRVDFNAPAILRKWPSIDKERVNPALRARPYMIEGTLVECIQQFMQCPNRNVICMKFTSHRNLIRSARFYRRTTSLNWLA